MKTAAAVVLVLALAGLFGKDKKKEPPPPPSYGAPPVVSNFECGDPANVQVDAATKQRIVRFGKQLYRNQVVSDDVLDEVAYYIVLYSRSYCLEPELAASLIARESGFNPKAVSSTGAKGLGQMIDSTARSMGVEDPFDIQQNLKGSLGYLKKLFDKCEGRPNQADLALASYLQGPNAVAKHGRVPDSVKRYIRELYEYRNEMISY